MNTGFAMQHVPHGGAARGRQNSRAAETPSFLGLFIVAPPIAVTRRGAGSEKRSGATGQRRTSAGMRRPAGGGGVSTEGAPSTNSSFSHDVRGRAARCQRPAARLDNSPAARPSASPGLRLRGQVPALLRHRALLTPSGSRLSPYPDSKSAAGAGERPCGARGAPHTAAAIVHPAQSFAGCHRAGGGEGGASPALACGPRGGTAVRVMTDVKPDLRHLPDSRRLGIAPGRRAFSGGADG